MILRMNKYSIAFLVSFLCAGMFTGCATAHDNVFIDSRDSNTYRYAQIGNQIWMLENLRFDVPKNSMSYDDDPVMGNKYGRLYRWNVAKYACPDGWHLPTDEEWKELEIFLGMESKDADSEGKRDSGNVGDKLKSTLGWEGTNKPGTDVVGFSALPGGFRWLVGTFSGKGHYTYFWTATDKRGGMYYYRYLSADSDGINRYFDRGANAMSIRCIKD
jgi:uncharacterized protein (TIGR02145 family)